MKKLSVLSVAVLITMSIFMQGCCCLPIPLIADPSALFGCSHEWQDATCTDPQICAVCGETAGSPNGHNLSEGTCTTPPTCATCGEAQGEAPGHEMTATSNFCVVCGEFEYYELRAVRGIIDMFTSGYDEYRDQGYIESYEILDVCYIVTNHCFCCGCDQYEYAGVDKSIVGEPYLTIFILYDEVISTEAGSGTESESGGSSIRMEAFGIHKARNDEGDNTYQPAVYALEYWFYWEDYEIVKVYAKDNSFFYEEDELIRVDMREIMSN